MKNGKGVVRMNEITLEAVLRDILYQMSRAEGKKVTDIANCFIAEYLNEPCFALPVSRLNELAKADREERCVILPVKIGDFVYMPLLGKILRLELIEISMTNYITIFKGVHGKLIFLFNEEDIGKGVFLTREEAERALKEREQNEKI